MPKRYIAVNDALNAMCDNCDSVQAVCPHFPCKRYTAVERIHSADVVEVVRCKDCVHYNAGFECLKEGYGIEYPPDYYCADGERKETEDAEIH